MPRQPTFPPYPPRPHASGLARITLRGKPIYLGTHGSPGSYQRYADELAQWQQRVGVPVTRPEPQGVTVARVVSLFLDHAEKSYDPRGREAAQFRQAVRPLLVVCGELLASLFDARQLKAVREAMLTGSWLTAEDRERYRQKGYAETWNRSVINRRIVRLRTLWRWAEEEAEIVPRGSWAGLRVVKPLRSNTPRVRQPEKPQATSRDDLNRVLPCCPAPVAAALEVQWLVGMRSCEVRQMRVADVDRDGPDGTWLYRARADADKNAWRGDQPSKVVPLGPECQRLLLPWLERAAAYGPNAYLFPCTRGNRRVPIAADYRRCYTTTSYAQAVRRACVQATAGEDLTVRERYAKLVRVRPYGGRHSAKNRITREYGLDAARAVLGQRSIATTNSYGQQVDVQQAAKVASQMS